MAAELFVPHVGTHTTTEDPTPRFIVQMRVPKKGNGGSPFVALSSRVARSRLLDVREAAAGFLKVYVRKDPL